MSSSASRPFFGVDEGVVIIREDPQNTNAIIMSVADAQSLARAILAWFDALPKPREVTVNNYITMDGEDDEPTGTRN